MDKRSNKKDKSPDLILEQDIRLSKSKLWDLQSAAYCQFGPRAWREKGVPFYITSNPFIARQYAQMVLGYIRDCLSPHAKTPLDPAQPLYIFDLGAGTGRFGHLFLKQLLEVLGLFRQADIKVRYIMTDIALSNINFWRTHPFLNRYIEQGYLDFAQYHHAEEEKPLELIVSGDVLSPETIQNPIVLIGNYFFDTIPQDLFLVKEGKVLEGRITLRVPQDEKTHGIDPSDPDIINYLKDSYDYFYIDNIDEYYPDFPELTTILKAYVETMENFPFLFPEGAFRSIRYFSKLARGRLLLLAGDQGTSNEEMLKHKKPYISLHGSFSIPVNYHAIARYFRLKGGMSLATTYDTPVLVVTASALGGTLQEFPETHLAFTTHVDYFDANDYFYLVEITEKEWMTPTIDFIILLIRLGNWDPSNCYLFFNRIRDDLPHATPETKEKLADAIHRMWGNYYHVGVEEAVFVMNLGVLFYDMEKYQDAILFYERALEINQEVPMVYENMALAYLALGEVELADQSRQKAVELAHRPPKMKDLLNYVSQKLKDQ